MIDKERFLANAASLGINADSLVEPLDKYAQMLVDYNTKVNLTAITDPLGIENKHFIDSLLLAQYKEVQGKLADVGTGAGFPGIVAKLAKPELELTLMEPTGKRVEFLRLVCEELGLKAEYAKERAEEAARKVWRESFDTVTARAVARLAALCEYCLPLLKVGGMFIAMKGEAKAELSEAMPAIKKLGGEYIRTESFTLPGGDVRCLIFIKKITQTPSVYPRNGAKIAKSPLN